MRPETLSLLCNPHTGEPLELKTRRGKGGERIEELVGVASGQAFPIQEGIPNFLDPHQTPRRHRLWGWVYDLLAFAYDPLVALGSRLRVASEERVRREFIASLPVSSGQRVLEVGVGTASNFEHLPPHAEYYGLDLSGRMLRRARFKLARLGREAELFQGDAQRLPFRDASFDLVFQMGTLQYLADPFQSVREMARVARPGACVAVVDEFAAAVRTLRRMPAHARLASGREGAVAALPRLAPHGTQALKIETLPPGEFYALTFQAA